uniref:Uncharacterized protein n=1 Tax=Anguilla anguilla TaxID=7936 RepID=A0A0E9U4T9_ANGAN
MILIYCSNPKELFYLMIYVGLNFMPYI